MATCTTLSMMFTVLTGGVGARLGLMQVPPNADMSAASYLADTGFAYGTAAGVVIATTASLLMNTTKVKRIATIGGALAVCLPMTFAQVAGKSLIGADSPMLQAAGYVQAAADPLILQ